MKKILVTTVVASALTLSAFAQGTISFSSANIKYSTDGSTSTKVPTGNPTATIPGYGALSVSVFSAAAGTTLSLDASLVPTFGAGWAQSSTVISKIAPVAGQITSTVIALGNVGEGASGQLAVVGWSGGYANFAAAAQAWEAGTPGVMIGWSGSTLSGGSLSWLQGTGAPNGTPSSSAVPLVTGAGGFNGLTLMSPVPEPTTLALAGLGAASLLLFRRRK